MLSKFLLIPIQICLFWSKYMIFGVMDWVFGVMDWVFGVMDWVFDIVIVSPV